MSRSVGNQQAHQQETAAYRPNQRLVVDLGIVKLRLELVDLVRSTRRQLEAPHERSAALLERCVDLIQRRELAFERVAHRPVLLRALVHTLHVLELARDLRLRLLQFRLELLAHAAGCALGLFLGADLFLKRSDATTLSLEPLSIRSDLLL